MGALQIESRKPEYSHETCRHCREKLEFKVPTGCMPFNVRCYSCKQNNNFDTSTTNTNGGSGSKKSRRLGTGKRNLKNNR